MDSQAANLLVLLKKSHATSEAKLAALNELKSSIKHHRVPESSQSTIIECIKLSIGQPASSTLASSAFSALSHLIKRLTIQDASGHAITHLAPRLFPAIHDRLGDMREPQRNAASQALVELYPYCQADVENMIRDEAISNGNARAKQAGLQWVLRMHREESMPFKSYTQAMVARLEDADGNVREAAKNTLIELFKDAPERAKTDLKRQMKAFSVRHSIESQVLAQLGSGAPSQTTSRPPIHAPEPEADMTASTRSLPTHDVRSHLAESIDSEAAQPPAPEVVPMDPIYMQSKSEVDETFRSMLPHFEGKETEQNWTPRDKSITKLRRMAKGNAPSEFHQAFMAGIKSMVEGILKVANSLRTTMSTNGCQLVQELARTLGPALDPHVEMFLQSFIKMSAATKHISAENGRITADAIFQHCSYHARMMQHIWLAAQDKNAQTRQCATEWLRTVLKRQASYRHHFETSGGLELAEKCIKKGLDDANPKVKENTRATYWTFAKTWPERANAISSTLDPKSKLALDRDSNNPNAALHMSQPASTAAAARSTGAASRNALREMMAEQRKAKAAGKLPDRPNSAMAQMSPARPRPTTNSVRAPSNLSSSARPEMPRVVSTASAAGTPSRSGQQKGTSLMSGPVRRPRRPELQRPQTADPYASRRMLRPETPAGASPGNSPPKGTAGSKASVAASSVATNRARTGGHGASPAESPVRRQPQHGHPAVHSRPTSKGSEDLTSVREDDFTMVMPKEATVGRAVGVLVHKRPALGQTMSVDAGIQNLTEDEGFTMVIPNLSQRRTQSPLTYRSPLKAMFEEAREKVESMSPKQEAKPAEPLPSLAERATTPRSNSPSKAAAAEEVQIYEDPFVADLNESQPTGDRQVLGELPINENVRMQSPTQSNDSSTSPTGSPRQIAEARSSVITSPQDRAEVLRNKRLLSSGIDRIRAKTLDAHGFRRVQDLAKSNMDIWDGGKKYDELMSVLLGYLQTFDQDPRLTQPPHKAAGLKAQALALVRALLYLHKKNAAAWHARTLVAVLACRVGVEAGAHALADIERTAEEVVKQAAPEGCIDAVVDFLPSLGGQHGARRSTAMALDLLRQLLDKAKAAGVDLGAERKVRLVQTTAKYLDDADAEVRKADVELASDLFELFGSSKADFWSEFKGTDEGRLGLLTYYIARRGKKVQ